MSFEYKVAIIGPIPRDTIITHNGELIEKYGCIAHSSIGLSYLVGKKSTVIPVCNVRKKDKKNIIKLFSKYKNIDISFIDDSYDMGDVISLKFLDQNHRIEKQLAAMHPIVENNIVDALDCDAYLFVPVTDFEISYNLLKFIKSKNSDSIIVFDAHGPTNVMTISGDRVLKFWVDIDLWLPYIDVLKMNIEEAYCCWFKKEYTLEEFESCLQLDDDNLNEFAQYCLQFGVSLLCITLDEKGCLIFYLNENKEVEKKFVKAIHVENIIDTTGCGDSFAAGLTFGMLYCNDYVLAAQYANILGALRTQGKTFDVFKTFDEIEEIRIKSF